MGPWTLTHLYQIVPTFVISAALSIFVAKAMRNAKDKLKYIPLQVIAVLLLILEVIKQIYNIKEYEAQNFYAIPLHYCSLFIYVLPFHAFYRGKHRQITDAVAFSCLASLMIFMILMPTVVYTDGDIKSFFRLFEGFHTVLFHNLVVLYFMLTLALKLYSFDTRRDLISIGVFLSVYVTVAAIFAYTLKTNFHNLYRCNINFIENVHLRLVESLGIFGTLLYVLALFIATILFTFASYCLARLFIKATDKK